MGSFATKGSTKYADYHAVTNEYGTIYLDYSEPTFDDLAFFTYTPLSNRDNGNDRKMDDEEEKKHKGGKDDKRNK